jgi:hypothetical protein
MKGRESDDWKKIQERLRQEQDQGLYRGPIRQQAPPPKAKPASPPPKTYAGGGSERRFEAAKRYTRNLGLLPKKQQENILGGTRKLAK